MVETQDAHGTYEELERALRTLSTSIEEVKFLVNKLRKHTIKEVRDE